MKNELIIGNYVIRNKVTVTCDEQTFWDIKNKPEEYKPIPLTEEWLQKFGFEKRDKNERWPIDSFKKVILNRGVIHFYMKADGVDCEIGNKSGYSFGKPKIKYVHQLQNLYFALTGEELTIK